MNNSVVLAGFPTSLATRIFFCASEVSDDGGCNHVRRQVRSDRRQREAPGDL